MIDALMPPRDTREYRKVEKLLKDAGSKQKMRWLYVNKLTSCILVFIVSIVLFVTIHLVELNFVYTEPTTSYTLIGEMSEREEKKAKAKIGRASCRERV